MKNGVEQEQYLHDGYYCFKKFRVHQMLAHSFYGYKEGFVVHHKNFDKTENMLENLVYLTREQHVRLHKKGKKRSEQTKTKISAGNKGNKNRLNKKHSEQSKAKMRVAANKKPVYCLEINKVFESSRAAARELSLAQSSIIKCCRGKQKTVKGYRFEYHFN